MTFGTTRSGQPLIVIACFCYCCLLLCVPLLALVVVAVVLVDCSLSLSLLSLDIMSDSQRLTSRISPKHPSSFNVERMPQFTRQLSL